MRLFAFIFLTVFAGCNQTSQVEMLLERTATAEHSDIPTQYVDRLLADNRSMWGDPETKFAWKKAMVQTLLQTEVEHEADAPNPEEIEGASADVRIDRIRPNALQFSAISIFAKGTVDDVTISSERKKEALQEASAEISTMRESLFKEPTVENLHRLSKKFDDNKRIGVALKIHSAVLEPNEPRLAGYLFHPALAQKLKDAKPGDVVISTQGWNALVAIAEPPVERALDAELVRAEAVERLLTKIREPRFNDILTKAYKPARVTFHPNVIADETKGNP